MRGTSNRRVRCMAVRTGQGSSRLAHGSPKLNAFAPCSEPHATHSACPDTPCSTAAWQPRSPCHMRT